jgi:2,3-bisphosphoglycerate-independent phosphoglycerate mutase
MINEDGSPNTAHSTNLVPCIFFGEGFELTSGKVVNDGVLGDIAPTILHYLEIEKPVEMTGKSLF